MDAERKLAAVDRALAALSPAESSCILCPRDCRVDRTRDEPGICRTGRFAAVSRALLHFGEEPVLSGLHDARRELGAEGRAGRAGSGTIFFAGCNLKCLFCQNYQLSWLNEGEPVDDDALAGMMLDLQAQGALNINLVSPTHVVLPVLRALRIAYNRGLDRPLVWNSNGYEHAAVVRALDGVVDVYLPDLKFLTRRFRNGTRAPPTTSTTRPRRSSRCPSRGPWSKRARTARPCGDLSSAISSFPGMRTTPSASCAGFGNACPLTSA